MKVSSLAVHSLAMTAVPLWSVPLVISASTPSDRTGGLRKQQGQRSLEWEGGKRSHYFDAVERRAQWFLDLCPGDYGDDNGWNGPLDTAKDIAVFTCPNVTLPADMSELDNHYTKYDWKERRGVTNVLTVLYDGTAFATFDEIHVNPSRTGKTTIYGREAKMTGGAPYGQGGQHTKNGKGDRIFGSPVGHNTLIGREGDDYLVAGDMGDRLRADAGNDTLIGGAGNDWLYTGRIDHDEGGNYLYGGGGTDTFVIGETDMPYTYKTGAADWEGQALDLGLSLAGDISNMAFTYYGGSMMWKAAVPMVFDVIKAGVNGDFGTNDVVTYIPPSFHQTNVMDFNPAEDVVIVPLNFAGQPNIVLDGHSETLTSDELMLIYDSTGDGDSRIASIRMCDASEVVPWATSWFGDSLPHIYDSLMDNALLISNGKVMNAEASETWMETINGVVHNYDNGGDETFGDSSTLSGLGDEARYLVFGAIGPRRVQGDGNVNYLFGTKYDDVLAGYIIKDGYNVDPLPQDSGSDQLYGLDGDDLFYAGSGMNIVHGGPGSDTISYVDAVVGVEIILNNNRSDHKGAFSRVFNGFEPMYDANTLTGGYNDLFSIENIIGTLYDDILVGNADDNHFWTMGGNDKFTGNAGADVFTMNGGYLVIEDFDPSEDDQAVVDGDLYPSQCGADALPRAFSLNLVNGGNHWELQYTNSTSTYTLIKFKNAGSISEEVMAHHIHIATTDGDICLAGGHWIGCGDANSADCTNQGGSREAQDSDLHEVRCCAESDPGHPDWLQNSPTCSVWGGSKDANGNCFSNKNYQKAQDICAEMGARLCTIEELENNCAEGSGCNHNSDYIWSSTPNSHYAVCGDGGGCSEGNTLEERDFYHHEVRCCKENNSGNSNWKLNSGCSVYAASQDENGNCHHRKTYFEAMEICNVDFGGARLCSKQELEDGCAATTGCYHDSDIVWSGTSSSAYWVECGRAGYCSDLPRPAEENELFDVRCCADSDLGSGWKQHEDSCPNVWGGTDESGGGVCFGQKTFAQAKVACESQGARLCTRTELESDCTATTGCGFDEKLVWTQTPVYNGRYAVCGRNGQCNDGGLVQAHPTVDQFKVRCCSNSDLELPYWEKKNQCSVWGGVKNADSECGGADTRQTYAEALDLCQGLGARLCSKRELLDNCAAGTSCSLDDELVWSKSTFSQGRVEPTNWNPSDGVFTIVTKHHSKRVHTDIYGDRKASVRSAMDLSLSLKTTYIIRESNDGWYTIRTKAQANQWNLDSNDSVIKSALATTDNNKFKFKKNADGTKTIRVKSTGDHLHVDMDGDDLVSTRFGTVDNKFTRFHIERYWNVLDTSGFESGYGALWIDGGSDSSRINNANLAASGSYSVRLRDNNGQSKIYTNNFYVGGDTFDIRVCLSFLTQGYDAGNYFRLMASKDNGSYETRWRWFHDDDGSNWSRSTYGLENNQQYQDCVKFSIEPNNYLALKIVSEANRPDEYVFLDDIEVSLS